MMKSKYLTGLLQGMIQGVLLWIVCMITYFYMFGQGDKSRFMMILYKKNDVGTYDRKIMFPTSLWDVGKNVTKWPEGKEVCIPSPLSNEVMIISVCN